MRGVRSRLSGVDGRRQRDFVLAAITGVVVGLGVAAFEWVTRQQLYDRLTEAPLAVQAIMALLGLLAAALALRFLAAGASPATADEYIKNSHEPHKVLALEPVLGRIVAGAATLGSGGALGFEGPSLYLGAAVGSGLQRGWGRQFSPIDTKVLMVAGAPAGVAAIFKTPATGAIFALEVPHQDDTAHHMLLPALVAESTGRAGFIVPGVIAAVAAQLLMGHESVPTYHRRPGQTEAQGLSTEPGGGVHLERPGTSPQRGLPSESINEAGDE